MAKRLKLDVLAESSYRMMGITTTLSDYRLAYYLSRLTGLEYRHEGEIESHIHNASFSIPFFAVRDKRNKIDFFLLPNKMDGMVLFPAERRFDFWLLCGGDGEPDLQVLAKEVMRLPGVEFCYELDVSRLKDADAFFTDVEMGTIQLVKRWRGRIREEDARW